MSKDYFGLLKKEKNNIFYFKQAERLFEAKKMQSIFRAQKIFDFLC